jgi:hypothetical protein
VVPQPQPELAGGPWRRTYRVFSSQGWIGIHNRNVGALELGRGANRPDGTFALSAVQKLAFKGGILQTIAVQATCNLDELATLREWSVSSTITDSTGRVEPMLSLYAHYALDDRILSRTTWNAAGSSPAESTANEPFAKSADAGSAEGMEAGPAAHGQADGEARADAGPARDRARAADGRRRVHPHKTKQVEPPVTSDWGLFEAVSRLPLRQPRTATYTSMDGLTVVKPRQRLYYREGHRERLADQQISLRGFYQIGLGALPYQYWVDEHRRVVMMISMNRVYFLDDDAERILAENLAALRSTGDYIERN